MSNHPNPVLLCDLDSLEVWSKAFIISNSFFNPLILFVLLARVVVQLSFAQTTASTSAPSGHALRLPAGSSGRPQHLARRGREVAKDRPHGPPGGPWRPLV